VQNCAAGVPNNARNIMPSNIANTVPSHAGHAPKNAKRSQRDSTVMTQPCCRFLFDRSLFTLQCQIVALIILYPPFLGENHVYY
jgi:hypothetical protein